MKKYWIFTLLLISSISIAASSPRILLQKTADQMIVDLNRHKATIQKNPQTVYRIIRNRLLPHVDITGMSRSAIGKQAWQNATAGERQQFTRAFSQLVTRTYARALAQYTNETVQFLPVRGGYQGKKRVQVHSSINRAGGRPIKVNYRVIQRQGRWKIYDFIIEGVSLLHNYHNQFVPELKSCKKSKKTGCVAKLTKKLTKLNRQK